MRTHIALCALLGLGACFEEPENLAIDDHTTGDLETTITPTTAPPPPSGSASSTSGPDGSSSGEPAEESSDGSSSSGSSSSSGAESESDSSSSSGEPAYEGPYGDCWDGPVQSKEGEYLCAPSSCVVNLPDHSACAPPCEGGCEAGPDGAPAQCLAALTPETVPEVCVLPCGDCPDGLECKDSGFADDSGGSLWVCMWP